LLAEFIKSITKRKRVLMFHIVSAGLPMGAVVSSFNRLN